ncbi:DeoR/GlpR family DNA-binding transcription regulator [Bartonella tamiae]|uniref:HTH deoR-type domain-containing protein n=1 Tax=Bartonella tamiae Th239 TaxID=1094558 RepID=J1JXF3_9HYPH|nr:DeoR/GlpR family DNA-binding transcription regulator [Bartonella tamiae]EJF89300.1 hypothetical protein ME5_01851 [Bartonella tamiae Th239]EJF95538.1 hypothetical protein MEG_00028 [Bartonella tamiae Th307]
MIPAERQAHILERLSERSVLSIAEISAILDVSQMTVRRDIRVLEDQGRAVSVAGGVQLIERIITEPSHLAKRVLAHEQKAAIGRFAAKMVKDGGVIYLDAGTTILEIAHHITDVKNLTVVTNDFVIAAFLAQESACRIFHTGGEIERENQSCVGAQAVMMIQSFNFDLSFISTSSFGFRGISTPHENKIAVKRAIIESSSRRILVTDSSKYGRIGAFNVIPLDRLSAVITDEGLSQNGRDAINLHGIALHLVDYPQKTKEE